MCCWCPPLGVPGCCYAHSALCGGLAMVGNGSPHGRRSLGLNFVLEGSSGLSGHGIGEQLLLLSATWVSCSLGLLLSSLGVSAQKDHRAGNEDLSLSVPKYEVRAGAVLPPHGAGSTVSPFLSVPAELCVMLVRALRGQRTNARRLPAEASSLPGTAPERLQRPRGAAHPSNRRRASGPSFSMAP